MFKGPFDPNGLWIAPQEAVVSPPIGLDPLENCVLIFDPALEAIQAANEAGAAVGRQQSGDAKAGTVANEETGASAEKFLHALKRLASTEVEPQPDSEHLRADQLVKEKLEIPEPPKHVPFVDRGWFEELKELNRQTEPTGLPEFDHQLPARPPYDPSRMRWPRFSGRVRIPSFARTLTYRCHRCGGQIKERHCENCDQEFCDACGLALEGGRCPDRSCISHRAALCPGCGEKECCCES